MRAIILDDNQEICALVAEAVSCLNERVVVTGTFTRPPTLAELERAQPHIAILDVIGCQGIEVARQIHLLFPRCGILFFTAYQHPSIAEAAARLPNALLLYKPFSLEKLAYTINQLAQDQTDRPEECAGTAHQVRTPRRTAAQCHAATPPLGMTLELWQRMSKLTPREIEYAYLRALGLSNRKIAERLNIGVQRANNLGSRLLHKTGCRSMCECITLLHRARVLGRDEILPTGQ